MKWIWRWPTRYPVAFELFILVLSVLSGIKAIRHGWADLAYGWGITTGLILCILITSYARKQKIKANSGDSQ